MINGERGYSMELYSNRLCPYFKDGKCNQSKKESWCNPDCEIAKALSKVSYSSSAILSKNIEVIACVRKSEVSNEYVMDLYATNGIFLRGDIPLYEALKKLYFLDFMGGIIE